MRSEPLGDAAEHWRRIFEEGQEFRRIRWVFRRLPRDPRCRLCHAPFHGLGGRVLRITKGIRPSALNPRYCNDCELLGAKHPGGVETEVAILFADVRGSTALAEQMSALEFSALIDHFYRESAKVLIRADALIEKLIGDAVTAIFVPGLAGRRYVARAIEAGRDLIAATGRGTPEGGAVPVGVGVHAGRAFVGAVGQTEGVATISALGDTVNVAARLSDAAAAGEVLVSTAAYAAAGHAVSDERVRRLQLKGHKEPVDAVVLAPATR